MKPPPANDVAFAFNVIRLIWERTTNVAVCRADLAADIDAAPIIIRGNKTNRPNRRLNLGTQRATRAKPRNKNVKFYPPDKPPRNTTTAYELLSNCKHTTKWRSNQRIRLGQDLWVKGAIEPLWVYTDYYCFRPRVLNCPSRRELAAGAQLERLRCCRSSLDQARGLIVPHPLLPVCARSDRPNRYALRRAATSSRLFIAASATAPMSAQAGCA